MTSVLSRSPRTTLIPGVYAIIYFSNIIMTMQALLQGLGVGPNADHKKQKKNVRKITFFSLKNKIYPKKIFFFAYIF